MLLDTHAWVELFNASAKGSRVAELMKREQAATSIVSLSELASWALKNGLDEKQIMGKVRETSAVLPLTEEIAELAGRLHFTNRKQVSDWGMVDSIIYATALSYGLKLVTGDKDFEGLKNAIVV